MTDPEQERDHNDLWTRRQDDCTHPYTIDRYCIKCRATNVEPKIEEATPKQWKHRLNHIIEARLRSRQ